MKSKKGFELAINTLVVIVLAVLVLLALGLALTGSFGKFWVTIKNYFVSDVDVAEKACENACISHNSYDFCCLQREVNFGKGKEKITCLDKRLKVECEINCEGVC